MKAEPVDMSAQAVAQRLEEVRALYLLAVSLEQATIGERVEDEPSAEPTEEKNGGSD